MKQFVETILEEKSKAIKHLMHLGGESHLISKAETDAELTRMENLHSFLKNKKSNVKTIGIKADGSPSFEMGHTINPDTGESQFGVAYKGAAKGYAFTQSDVLDKFGHSPGLHSKMSQLLEHGRKVMTPLHGVVQGDFMGSKKDNTIEEEGNDITHKENLIKYHYDKNSVEGKQLKNAKISIALHTRISDEQPEYNIDTNKFHTNKDVHIFNNKVDQGNLKHNDDAINDFESNLNKAKEHLGGIVDHDSLVQGHTDHLQTYINKTVREGTNPTSSGYRQHLQSRLQKDIDKLKTPAAKLRKSIDMQNTLGDVDTRKEEFNSLFKGHIHLDKAKNAMLKTLESSPQNQRQTINNNHTMPEGFVVSYNDGSVRKIVNRSKEGFSGLNLNK
jgi:hypothetical protein